MGQARLHSARALQGGWRGTRRSGMVLMSVIADASPTLILEPPYVRHHRTQRRPHRHRH